MNELEMFLSILAILAFLLHSCAALDTISVNQSIKDGHVIVSSGEVFAVGFFSPGKSSYRYLGIWYNKVPEKNVVWVANRDSPINDSSGVLLINSQGNLVLYSRNQNKPLWLTNVSVSSVNSSIAQLLDSGNLVLYDARGIMKWQSFDYPTDTMLPNLKVGLDRRTGLNRYLTSWKSPDDPGIGNWSYRLNPNGSPQLFLYEGQVPRWRSGHWDGLGWTGIPMAQRGYASIPSFVNNEDGLSITFSVVSSSIFMRLILDESGYVRQFTWRENEARWLEFWSPSMDRCDNYGQCGANGNCNLYSASDLECTCLPGFQPKSQNEWNMRDGSGGCIRKNQTSICRNGEGFIKVANLKVPDTSMALVKINMDSKACEEECLRNCSCMAYSTVGSTTSGCLTWHGDLVDTRVSAYGGQDLFVRVDALELAQYAKSREFRSKKGMLPIVVSSIAAAVLFFALFSIWLAKKKRKHTVSSEQPKILPINSAACHYGNTSEKELDESGTSPYLPFFDISIIVAATENFSTKLGQGGFGSVYKGQLANGQEIAVKRLSKSSGQGMQEFKNEVRLISKLQHKNLVKLFGCCIHEEEKMLIYEYLPNRSLDFFIFDEIRRLLLDWRKRSEIIFGIARGVLYLHQDSRLKIIHRDLKASNILLDAAMNPKISDFGLAKLFGEEQVEANTRHVVGTYGYMSPEYAMDGLYSIKSDIFSFGVLTLETICGKKNTDYHEEMPALNLIGHVWDLWRAAKVMDIVDPLLEQSYSQEIYSQEIMRCIHIGLLCVQESPADRPTMLEVLFMLGNEVSLPPPKKPAFLLREHSGRNLSLLAHGRALYSVNRVTVSIFEAR